MHRVYSIIGTQKASVIANAITLAWEAHHINRSGGFTNARLSHLNGVKSQGFEAQEPVLPELWVDPEVVYPVRGSHVSREAVRSLAKDIAIPEAAADPGMT